ncbi:hypothetical protein AB0K00_30615 [Dactylosporangium sp. NPDC049525]|uniref:hypothetical protein n=1 Tax=Dactylosporangium sp. NPDC049525 TaxID=3154730 RepID=UPI0034336BD9
MAVGMASSDDIERAMQHRIAEERKQKSNEERLLAERLTAGAQAAQGFIELMRKRGVEPDPIYRYEQVTTYGKTLIFRETKKGKTIDRYELADRGWVVRWSVNEYNEPWLIKYLRPDGLLGDCEMRPWPNLATQNRYYRCDIPAEGLMEGPSLGQPNARRVLCLKRFGNDGPRSPSLTVGEYAIAAQHYLMAR